MATEAAGAFGDDDRREIVIDIQTRILRPDERVHILFPGNGHALFQNMVSKRMVYLDLPGVVLPPKEKHTDKRLVRRIHLAQAVKEYALSPDEHPNPSRDPTDYDDKRTRSLARLLGAIRELYYELPNGELIIVPGSGHWGEAFIGEIDGDVQYIKDPLYPNEEIPARPVRWLAKHEKRKFSKELFTRLGTKNFLIRLDKSLNDQIFRVAYPSYTYLDGTVARINTTRDGFSTLDEYSIQTFLNFAAAAYGIAESYAGYGLPPFTLDVETAIEFLLDNPQFVPELATNINSPGALTLMGAKLAPLAAVVLIALAVEAGASEAAGAAPAVAVRVVNSKAPPDDVCTIRIDESVRQSLQLMDVNEWQKLCARMTATGDRTGLKTHARIRHDPSRRRRS